MRASHTAAVFRNPHCAAWEMAPHPVILLFSLPMLDLSVSSAVYLLSGFHDPWALENLFKTWTHKSQTHVSEKNLHLFLG